MRSKKHIGFILFLSFCLILLFSSRYSFQSPVSSSQLINQLSNSTINWKSVTGNSRFGIHPLLFSDEEAFLKATKTAHVFTNQQLKGGIVPHHLVASDNLANFFLTLKQSNPQTIILVGPNHYEKGDFDVLTSLKGWYTPYGIVEPSSDIINTLIDNNLAHIDEDALEHDHSVAGLMPFISYYLPNATVVPLIVKHGFSLSDADTLATKLASYCHSGTEQRGTIESPCPIFFIASVDFSHYLTKDIAEKKDAITQKAIETKNYEALLAMSNDYLDSPPSLITLMKVMEKIHADGMKIFAHTNSADYPNSDQKSTTSHFIVGFW